ncbi:FMN-binding negative transcriptional regulator [Deinococcus sp.]|uniref:FMN-binding negative transcriptional regulator n=1 Tax=Deinococcus sp. TaxID=47478 RepID=UPI003C7A0BD1
MYLPPEFQEQDRRKLLDLMRAAPFALVVSAGEDGTPYATPVPVLLEEDSGGLRLRWHLSRANPHAAALAGREGLVVFQGPHALVDSAWYTTAPQVGTWNYQMVQASGPVSVLENDQAAQFSRALTRTLTPDAPPIPPEFEAKMLRGVVTFELVVTRLEGKSKLSQNKGAADREAVRAHLAGSDREEDRAVARLMVDKG